jgi:hypothetical protein
LTFEITHPRIAAPRAVNFLRAKRTHERALMLRYKRKRI